MVRDLQAGKVDAEDESHKDIQPGADGTSSASANAPADDVPNSGRNAYLSEQSTKHAATYIQQD